jgi:hypothetical protein
MGKGCAATPVGSDVHPIQICCKLNLNHSAKSNLHGLNRGIYSDDPYSFNVANIMF